MLGKAKGKQQLTQYMYDPYGEITNRKKQKTWKKEKKRGRSRGVSGNGGKKESRYHLRTEEEEKERTRETAGGLEATVEVRGSELRGRKNERRTRAFGCRKGG